MKIVPTSIELKQIAVANLIPCPFNPPSRTKNVNSVVDSIERFGFINPIHVFRLANQTWGIIDGNRRHQALTLINSVQDSKGGERYNYVPCIVHDESNAYSLWSALSENKKTTSAEWLSAWVNSGRKLKIRSPKVNGQHKRLLALFDGDVEAMAEVCLNGPHPVGGAVLQLVDRLSAFLTAKVPEEKVRDIRILLWLVNCQQQGKVQGYVRNPGFYTKANAKKVVRAIKQGLTLDEVFGFAKAK
jgi:ParB-like nuclease domain